MSNETHTHNPQDPHGYGIEPAVSPENESLPVGTIAMIAIVSCTCFALGILWAVQIMHGVEDDTARIAGPWHKAEMEGKPEIGIVDQQLYEREHRAHDLAVQKNEKLDQYAWVSRKDGLIQIPIAEAMKAVAAGKRAPKTEQQPPPQMPGEGTPGATPTQPGGSAVPGAPGTPTGPQSPAAPAAPAPQGAQQGTQTKPQGAATKGSTTNAPATGGTGASQGSKPSGQK